MTIEFGKVTKCRGVVVLSLFFDQKFKFYTLHFLTTSAKTNGSSFVEFDIEKMRTVN